MSETSQPFKPRKMRASIAAVPKVHEKENSHDRRKRSQSIGGTVVELSPRKKARRSLVSCNGMPASMCGPRLTQ
jgi:predicted alpha/beta hydrolase